MPDDGHRTESAFEPAALAAREAEILGKPPRLPPMSPEEIGPDAMQVIRDIRRAVGLDPDGMTAVPDYMSTILRHTELYRNFNAYGLQLLNGELSARHRELAILRVGWLCRAPFEWGEHVTIGRRCGLTGEEIERVVRGSADPAWEPSDRAIVRAVEELHADAMISDETWAELAKFLDKNQLIELPFLIGHYHAVAFYQNAMRLRPPPESRGLASR